MELGITIRQRRRTQSPGFTLVEVVVAILVAGIVGVSLYAGLAQSFSLVQSSRHRLRAAQILTEKLEVIRLYNWNQINAPGFVPATFTEYYHPTNGAPGSAGIVYNGTISILTNVQVHPSYQATMRKVVAQINWVSGGISQQLGMETLISQHGVQNYIY